MEKRLSSPWDRVQAARSAGRPTARAFIEAMLTDFTPLCGDRRFGEDSAVLAGPARLHGKPLMVVGLEKGVDTKDKIAHNFGSAQPEGYRKSLRLMKQAEKFRLPLLCLVDTSGAYCGIGAEERGQGQAIAENLTTLMGLQTPVVSVLIGEGGSGGALALALSDRVWILENAVYSVISPEGCASILWKDSKKVKDAAESLRLTAQDMLELGVVEQVIPEEKEFSLTYAKLQEELEAALSQLGQLPVEELLEQRYQRFRKY